LNTKSTV